MTPRTRSRFVCASCGGTTLRWAGRCPECGEWNSLVEEIEERAAARGRRGAPPAKARPLAGVDVAEAERLSTGVAELDRLPQIGATRAQAIITARAKARFKDWDDFVARKVVPSSAEAAIKDLVGF